ncbi:MAG: PfkB family carbohydrate kinase [Candidatus Dormibacteraeota bacterium]|nr:PfkB family carbohydrate kinase [Candidatus Dormibacteraeota bacterium]
MRDELGGSALYFALAASLLQRVRLVAPVGRDAEEQVRRRLRLRPRIDASGLDVLEAPTYRWSAREEGGRNIDLGSADAIYDSWSPRLPSRYRGWAFIGSMRPDRQNEAARALAGAELLAADAMRSYVAADPPAVRALLHRCHWYFANEEELEALGGRGPQQFRRAYQLCGLVVKRGALGATVYTELGRHHEPARFQIPAVDTTGAGDALAGGLLARWLQLKGDPQGLPEALRYGVAAAGLASSGLGQRGLLSARRTDLESLAAA